MNNVSLKVYVGRSNFDMGIEVAIVLRSHVTKIAKVVEGGKLEFVTIEENSQYPHPTLRLDREMATELLAGLLALNLPIPSAGAIEGELKATKIHLEDLRQLLKITKRSA